MESAPLVFAHFRVHQRPDGTPWTLGAGGMGLTYKALDTRLQTDVALKVIHPARFGDRETERLFLREARAAAKVNHPNVAGVTFLEDSRTLFYAMEFVDGVTLHGWLRRNGRLPVGQALALAEQIAHGLSAIHERNLVHRDLKPANLMVVSYPANTARFAALRASGGCLLKIIDFGLARPSGGHGAFPAARADDDPEPTAGFRGTAAYASPEQCEERTDLDARSDLYALGCILWEMLAGQPPFVARTQREIVNLHVAGDPPWAALHGAPESIRVLLARLLAKRREERPANANETAQALSEARRALGARASERLAPAAAEMPTDTIPATIQVTTPAPPPSASAPPSASGTRITIELPPQWRYGAAALGLLLFVLAFGAVFLFSPGPHLRPTAALPTPTPVAAGAPTVAVLRFVSLGGDAAGEQFARGVSEDLLGSLHKVRGLRIVSLASGAVPEDRARLGLAGPRTAFLEGTVRRQGTKVRITARLTDAASGVQLWSETYERELADAFEIQQGVAEKIARALAANLTDEEKQTLGRRPTRSAEAYELYLSARTLWHSGQRNRAVNDEVVQQLTRATSLDPEFALAWAYLARAHNVLYFHALDRTPERLARARAAAERALRLQPDLPEAHIAFARVQWFEDPQPQLLLRAYRQVLVLAPGNAEALEALADIHTQLLQPEDSLAVAREAASRAPDDVGKVANVASRYAALRRFAEAEEWYRRAADLSQNNPARVLRYELAVAERGGEWERYRERAAALIPLLPPDTRWIEQTRQRDYRGALATLATISGAEVALNWQRVPKTLVTSALHRLLGDEAAALADGRAALASMQASKDPRTVEAGWQVKLAQAHARAGDRAQARAVGEAALRLAPVERGAIVTMQVLDDLVQLYAEVGEPERGVQLLGELLRMPWWGSIVAVQHWPQYDGLRASPAFEALVRSRM